MSMPNEVRASILYVAVPILILEIILIASASRPRSRLKQQHEGDIRLPYKRYKKLYPNTRMSYDDYKEMQTRDSYKRSINSKELRRMVR